MGEIKGFCAVTQPGKVIQLLILGEKFYLSFLFRDGGQWSGPATGQATLEGTSEYRSVFHNRSLS